MAFIETIGTQFFAYRFEFCSYNYNNKISILSDKLYRYYVCEGFTFYIKKLETAANRSVNLKH